MGNSWRENYQEREDLRKWYILKRNEEIMIVGTCGDPLRGRGSWDLKSGPYDSYEEAEKQL